MQTQYCHCTMYWLFLIFVLCMFDSGSGNDLEGHDQIATLADINKLKEEVSAILHGYQQKIEKQENEIKALKSDIVRLSSAESQRKDQKRVAEVPNTAGVAFYAQLSADQSHFGTHQTVLFDRVRTNIGNAYNHDDGIFTAPKPGIYVFFWTTANKDNTHMQTELVVNGAQYGRVWADSGDHVDYSMAFNSVVVHLDAGNTVWIRSDSFHSGFTSGQNFATFSGWLLNYE